MKTTTHTQSNSQVTSFTPIRSGFLQRKCACGGNAGLSGKCEECQKNQLRLPSLAAHPTGPAPAPHTDTPGFGHHFSRMRVHRADAGGDNLSDVHRSTVHRDRHGGGRTNRRFDTFAITERDLSDPDVIARLNALSKVGLIEYRRQVKDLAVIEYITSLIDQMPALPPCTTEEAKKTSEQAEAARVAGLPLVTEAVKALGTVVTSNVLCAFASNFNTTGADPEFQARRLIVARRLGALAVGMKTAVPYGCVPADDPVCMGGKNADTVAYVRGHKPPIKFCPAFRSLAEDALLQQAIVIHEYAHLVGSVDDAGGYSAWGATVGTCPVGSKFKAQGDVLINTADALTGFVMHVGLGLSPPAPAAPPAGSPVATAEETETPGAPSGPTEGDGESAAG